jgi:hypothetical protein
MEAVLSFESSDDGLPKVVRDYRARYRAVSQVLDDNSEILSAVHKDLQKLSEGDAKGRKGDYTSENILRALIVHGREGLTFRETIKGSDHQEGLQKKNRGGRRRLMAETTACTLVAGGGMALAAGVVRHGDPPQLTSRSFGPCSDKDAQSRCWF